MEKVQRWIREEPWLGDLLRWFVDRLKQPRSRDITRRIKPETVPALYIFDGHAEYRWALIRILADEYHVLDIKVQHVKPGEPTYHQAQLRLRPDAEAQLREWLDMPREDPAMAAWQQAVEEQFGKDHSLWANPVHVQGRSAREVVAALKELLESSAAGLTLREVSARHFWGDSKFLDGREDWLFTALGLDHNSIVPRPLLLTTYAPAEFSRLLLIENQDTFVLVSRRKPPDTALIYTGGFKASATRLAAAATFSFLPGSVPEDFLVRWQDPSLPAFFWGDLDFSGMGILASLRLSLPQLEAWRPAYELMLQHLLEGGGILQNKQARSFSATLAARAVRLLIRGYYQRCANSAVLLTRKGSELKEFSSFLEGDTFTSHYVDIRRASYDLAADRGNTSMARRDGSEGG